MNIINFTKDVLDYIIPKYKEGLLKDIYKKYPTLTKNSLYLKMSSLGIKTKSNKWSSEEISTLQKYYTSGNLSKIQELLPHRSYSAITSKAEKLGLKSREYWTTEEITLLIKNYSSKSVDEVCDIIPNRTRKTIIMKAMELGLKNCVKYQPSEIQFIKDNWNHMSDFEMGEILNRNPNGIANKRLTLGLSRYDIKKGTYDLANYIRGNNLDWKRHSMENCNYKCVLTGNRFDDVHHIHGFNLIYNEMLNTYNISLYDDITLYSEDELQHILQCFINIQNKYPLGVCLTRKIHTTFHEIYGYGNNTVDQWKEFKKYIAGN